MRSKHQLLTSHLPMTIFCLYYTTTADIKLSLYYQEIHIEIYTIVFSPFIYYTIHVALYYTTCLVNLLLYSVVPYKTSPNPDQPPTTNLQNPDQIPKKNMNNSEDNKP